MKLKKIIMTGGSGRFAKVFKKLKKKSVKIYYPSKKTLNIKSPISIKRYISAYSTNGRTYRNIIENR